MVEYKNLNLYYRDFTREATVTTVYSACVVKVVSVGSIAVPDLPQNPRCPVGHGEQSFVCNERKPDRQLGLEQA